MADCSNARSFSGRWRSDRASVRICSWTSVGSRAGTENRPRKPGIPRGRRRDDDGRHAWHARANGRHSPCAAEWRFASRDDASGSRPERCLVQRARAVVDVRRVVGPAIRSSRATGELVVRTHELVTGRAYLRNGGRVTGGNGGGRFDAGLGVCQLAEPDGYAGGPSYSPSRQAVSCDQPNRRCR